MSLDPHEEFGARTTAYLACLDAMKRYVATLTEQKRDEYYWSLSWTKIEGGPWGALLALAFDEARRRLTPAHVRRYTPDRGAYRRGHRINTAGQRTLCGAPPGFYDTTFVEARKWQDCPAETREGFPMCPACMARV